MSSQQPSQVTPEKGTPTRAAWEAAHPIEVAQEHELNLSQMFLSSLIVCPDPEATRKVTREQWVEAEKTLNSLEAYLKDHKIKAERIRQTKVDQLMVDIVRGMQDLDRIGIDTQSVDVQPVERVWGLADKLGSGLAYLLSVDKRRGADEAIPTTRSIFLLKSAPPHPFKFTTSRDEWREKQIAKFSNSISEIILSQDNPVTASSESRWNSAFRELEELEKLLSSGVSVDNIRNTKIHDTIQGVSGTAEMLSQGIEDQTSEDYSLMYITWEMSMRMLAWFEDAVNTE